MFKLMRNGTLQIKNELDYYVSAVLLLYPLYLSGGSFGGTSLKVQLLAGMSLTAAAVYGWRAVKGKAVPRRPSGLSDYFFLAYFICGLILAFVNMSAGKKDLSAEILTLSVIASYFLVSGGAGYRGKYLELILYSAAPVFAGLWLHYLVTPRFVKPVQLLTDNSGMAAAYLLLVFTVSGICYTKPVQGKRGWFYILMNGLSAFFLFITQDIAGMVLAPFCLLALLLVYRITPERIRRVMRLMFVYFFLLSNMPLAAEYSGLAKAGLTYDIGAGVYLELCIAVCCVLFFHFWEKLPAGMDLEKEYLPRVEKFFRALTALLGWSVLILLFAGNKLEILEHSTAGAALYRFVRRFQQYYMNHNGTFYDAAAAYGLIGILEAAFLALFLIWKVYKRCYEGNKELFLILCVFVAQSFFFSQQCVTTPVYIILTAMAIHGGSEGIPGNGKIEDGKNAKD